MGCGLRAPPPPSPIGAPKLARLRLVWCKCLYAGSYTNGRRNCLNLPVLSGEYYSHRRLSTTVEFTSIRRTLLLLYSPINQTKRIVVGGALDTHPIAHFTLGGTPHTTAAQTALPDNDTADGFLPPPPLPLSPPFHVSFANALKQNCRQYGGVKNLAVDWFGGACAPTQCVEMAGCVCTCPHPGEPLESLRPC